LDPFGNFVVDLFVQRVRGILVMTLPKKKNTWRISLEIKKKKKSFFFLVPKGWVHAKPVKATYIYTCVKTTLCDCASWCLDISSDEKLYVAVKNLSYMRTLLF
jgi:hypothetical protein